MTENKITLKGKVLSVDVDKLILEFEELEEPIKHIVRLDQAYSKRPQDVNDVKVYFEEKKDYTVLIKGDFVALDSGYLLPEFFVVGTQAAFDRRKF